PVARSSATSVCFAGWVNVTTYTTPAPASITGVLVMPDGSMFPHGRSPPLTGVPRCRRQRCFPVAASNAYTVLFSVATIARPFAINGSAYTSPSTVRDAHCRFTVAGVGPASTAPLRVSSRWYWGQSDGEVLPAPAVGVIVVSAATIARAVTSERAVTTRTTRGYVRS